LTNLQQCYKFKESNNTPEQKQMTTFTAPTQDISADIASAFSTIISPESASILEGIKLVPSDTFDKSWAVMYHGKQIGVCHHKLAGFTQQWINLGRPAQFEVHGQDNDATRSCYVYAIEITDAFGDVYLQLCGNLHAAKDLAFDYLWQSSPGFLSALN
jgi:hypothetical protein